MSASSGSAVPAGQGGGATPGKWPASDLARLLDAYGASEAADVLLGPAVGEDAAVVRVGGERLVVASDPITLTGSEVGYWSVIVNSNDVAATGADPRFFVATALLPVGVGREAVEAVFAGVADACRSVGAVLVGGHTERTAAVSSPVVVGTMLGLLGRREPLASGGARPGDRVVLTKGAAIEATAILARERGDRLSGQVDPAILKRAADFLADPGISILAEARIARDSGARAMHDVTEGGVVTGLWEMAEAAGLGIEVDAGAVPVAAETRALCEAVGIDPLEAIGSGALLVAASPEDAEKIRAAIEAAGIRAAVVGEFLGAGAARRLVRGGRTEPLIPPDVDALATFFA